MIWIIIIVIFFGICIYIGLSTGKELEEKNKKKFTSQGYNYIAYCGVEYKGGIKNISIDTPVTIGLLKEGLSFTTIVGDRIILFKNIIDISLQSRQYIESQVSLGKLIVFGILAFGMNKNQKKINDEYIVLKVNDDDGEYNILLQAQDYTNNQQVYNKIMIYKNK